MNPLQRHAILHSKKLAAGLATRNERRKNISTAGLIALVRHSNGLSEPTASESHTMPSILPSLSEFRADVAICVGSGNDPLAEHAAALALCEAAGKTAVNFVCNDSIPAFPGIVHHACTLHPEKWQRWRVLRERAGFPDPIFRWAHRSFNGFTNFTKDWQGSSGLFMVKIARELGYTHIILAGIPMTIEGAHFTRHVRWNAAPGFLRGWNRVQDSLRPFVRSMSGKTQEVFGAPDGDWLAADIPDPNPMKGPEHTGVKA